MARPETVTAEQVYACAHQMFAQHGPTLPIKKVAQTLGVSDAALFKRFGSKQDLYIAAMTSAIGELPDFADISSDLTPAEQVEQACFVSESYLNKVSVPMMQLAATNEIGFEDAAHLKSEHVIEQLTQALGEFFQSREFVGPQGSIEDPHKSVAKQMVILLHARAIYRFLGFSENSTPAMPDIVALALAAEAPVSEQIQLSKEPAAPTKKAKRKPTTKVRPTPDPGLQLDIFG